MENINFDIADDSVISIASSIDAIEEVIDLDDVNNVEKEEGEVLDVEDHTDVSKQDEQEQDEKVEDEKVQNEKVQDEKVHTGEEQDIVVPAEMITASSELAESKKELEETDSEQTDKTEKREIIFELKYIQKESFDKVHKKLMTAIQDALEPVKLDFTIQHADSEVRIIAYEMSEMEQIAALDNLFKIDTTPAKKIDTGQVPSYKRGIKETLNEDIALRKKRKKEAENICERPRIVAACFNCDATDHGIRDCPKPRNNQRISRAKKAHSARNERYHIDPNQRFSHIRPGTMSSQLRSAMGLQRGELPFFFYRMRVLGYPPGWLEDSKMEQSGLSLFNTESTDVDNCNDLSAHGIKFNVSKIVKYPGFNVRPGSNFYDDYKHQNVPPQNDEHLIENFIKSLGDNAVKGYKRKKMKSFPTVSNKPATITCSSQLMQEDMEIEDCNLPAVGTVVFSTSPPPLVADFEKLEPPPPPPGEETSHEQRTEELSLADLNAKKALILQQLESNTTTESIPEANDSFATDVSSTKAESEPPETPVKPSTSARKPKDIFLESHIGTPVLKFSPYDKLPSGDNFRVGVVGDVINFENLPDSTGKYEQMKGILKNVRTTIYKLHYEDD